MPSMTNPADDAHNHERNTPRVSFCIATYRRPERLSRTLHAIRAQTFPDFEVVVSDNDPAGSAAQVVTSFSDPRFRYFRNEENVGMVKNFNRALSHARGEYVVMMADDDPPYPHMLETLLHLESEHTGYGAYFGAFNLLIEDDAIAEYYGHRPGLTRVLHQSPEHTVRLFNKELFPYEFFNHRVFPWILWSAGIVRRDVLLETGGMPDYGSPHLTDHALISAVGVHSGMATVNTAVAQRTVYQGNFDRERFFEMIEALENSRRYLAQRISSRSDRLELLPLMERFLGVNVVAHFVFLHNYFNDNPERRREVRHAMSEILRIPYMRPLRHGFYVRVYIPRKVVSALRPMVRFVRKVKQRLMPATAF
jgi:glycosyltransferase involved in cell wall biosynthesis